MSLFRWFFRGNKRPSKASFHWERTPPRPPQEYRDSEGRRHRGDAPYLLPKDEQEMYRLDYQHFLLRQVLHGYCYAPVHTMLRKGCNVLDVGSGTGRWGHELATSYPDSRVFSLDL